MGGKCIILDGTCTWCGRRDKYGEVAACPIARDKKAKGFNIPPPIGIVQSLLDSEFECFWCCKINKKKSRWFGLNKDHVIPIARGGKYVKNNTVDACWRCNHMKGSLMPMSFLYVDGSPVPRDKVQTVLNKLKKLGIKL